MKNTTTAWRVLAAAVLALVAATTISTGANASSPQPSPVDTVAALTGDVAQESIGSVSTLAAAPAGYRFVRKTSSSGCFELLTNGTFYKMTNVCSNLGKTTRYTKLNYGGGTFYVCIGQHQYLHLGTRSEFTTYTFDGYPDGCPLKSAPYNYTGF